MKRLKKSSMKFKVQHCNVELPALLQELTGLRETEKSKGN